MTIAERACDPANETGAPGETGGIYDADYYLRGKESGKSLYTDYHWMPELTIPMCRRIVDFCRIHPSETILDFGCARGYVVRALREIGHCAYGMDISEWAIQNADPLMKPYLFHQALPNTSHDWILAKDVLEHLGTPVLERTLRRFGRAASKGLFVIVPLSPENGAPYVVPEYERDITHVQRDSLFGWVRRLREGLGAEWSVRGQYRVEGIKDNWAHYPKGNGFLTARRKGLEQACFRPAKGGK